jgi:hypothetical protein
MKRRLISITLVMLAAGLLGGCASLNNIETQRRIHSRQARPTVLRAVVLSDGSPAVGFELTSLSAWEAVTTNKPAATWAGLKDAAFAAILAWLGNEIADSTDGDAKKPKAALLDNMNNTTYIDNGSGGVTYNGPPPVVVDNVTVQNGINNSTIINNGSGWVNYTVDYPDTQQP